MSKSPTIIKSTSVGEGLIYEIKSSSVEDAIEKLKVSYKRNTGKKLSKENEQKYVKQIQQNKTTKQPILKNKYAINMLKIYLAFFKIAYELIFYLKLLEVDESEYLKDNKLKDVAKIISNYIYENVQCEVPTINKIRSDEIKEGLSYLSESFFNHKFFHCISIAACKNERRITYNISLLNSFDRYIVIDDIDCKNFNKTLFIDPISINVLMS